MSTIQIDTSRLTPCGYCRRCIPEKNDPAGCIEVYRYERVLIAAGFTPRQIMDTGSLSEKVSPEEYDRQVRFFEEDVASGLYELLEGDE